MPEISQDQLRELARLGAQARLMQLDAERHSIVKAFPGLVSKQPRVTGGGDSSGPVAPKARKPYRMSAAKRKAAAERMRAYWAKKRGDQAPAKAVAQADDRPAPRRSAMSAAERKAVSVRMKRYWAERRKVKGK